MIQNGEEQLKEIFGDIPVQQSKKKDDSRRSADLKSDGNTENLQRKPQRAGGNGREDKKTSGAKRGSSFEDVIITKKVGMDHGALSGAKIFKYLEGRSRHRIARIALQCTASMS